MKVHTGPLARTVEVTTASLGYRYKNGSEPEVFIDNPGQIVRKVGRLYGLSIGRWYIGAMRFDKIDTER